MSVVACEFGVTVAFSSPSVTAWRPIGGAFWSSASPATGGAYRRAMRPSNPLSVNHTLPSGPRVMPAGAASARRPRPGVPPATSVKAWLGFSMRPMRPGLALPVNQRSWSLPSASATGSASFVRPVRNSLIVPSVLMRPIAAGLPES